MSRDEAIIFMVGSNLQGVKSSTVLAETIGESQNKAPAGQAPIFDVSIQFLWVAASDYR